MTRGTHGVQSQVRTRHVMFGSNHNRFGELFVGHDLAYDVENHKLSPKQNPEMPRQLVKYCHLPIDGAT